MKIALLSKRKAQLLHHLYLFNSKVHSMYTWLIFLVFSFCQRRISISFFWGLLGFFAGLHCWWRQQEKDSIKQSTISQKNHVLSTQIVHHSLLGEVWLDDSSVCFKADSFGLADGSVLEEGDSVLSLSSPVFSSELALLSSLSAAFSGIDAGSALEVCPGKNREGNRRRRRKVGGGQKDELKGV